MLIVFNCGRVESMWCHAAVCLRWSRARHARSLWMQMPCLWHFSKLPCQIVVSPPSNKIHGILVLVWKWLKHTGILWHLAILPVKHEGTRKCMNLDVLIISCLHTSYYYGGSHVIMSITGETWFILVHLCSHALSGRDAGTWSSSFPLPSNLNVSRGIREVFAPYRSTVEMWMSTVQCCKTMLYQNI